MMLIMTMANLGLDIGTPAMTRMQRSMSDSNDPVLSERLIDLNVSTSRLNLVYTVAGIQSLWRHGDIVLSE